MKKKSHLKKSKKNKEEIKKDVTKEVGTINGFAIIEKLIEDKKDEKKEKEEDEKNKALETKPLDIDLTNLDEKNKSFFKGWIIYDNPNESRFAKLFKELEEDKKRMKHILTIKKLTIKKILQKKMILAIYMII